MTVAEQGKGGKNDHAIFRLRMKRPLGRGVTKDGRGKFSRLGNDFRTISTVPDRKNCGDGTPNTYFSVLQIWPGAFYFGRNAQQQVRPHRHH
ncbi:hypothetical protein [Roseibium aquae]|uniref:hypothetical protein n=1 Tax=Roseibium aquae TaxID=1323746 RepID=UPI001562ABE5|nr:hypothetical protein [Roseibium aquae]